MEAAATSTETAATSTEAAASSTEAAATYKAAAASASLSRRHGADSCKCHRARDEQALEGTFD
jgi:hypothetical protein